VPDSPELSLAWLPKLIARTKPDGSAAFTDREIDDFLAVLLISSAYDRALLTPRLVVLVEDFALRAGVTTGAEPSAREAAVMRYLEAHPLNPELLVQFRLAAREELVAEGAGEHFYKLLGVEPRKLTEPGTPPPKGAVPAGPLARFLVRAPDED
jgi:hypothetical protein